MDGHWTSWSSWIECSVTCGTEEKTRSRTCTNPEPAYGGDECTGDDTKTRSCDSGSCRGDGRFVQRHMLMSVALIYQQIMYYI